MNSFTDRSLLDLVTSIVDNRGRSCPTASSGTPLIATNCIKPGHREPVFEKVRYVDEETMATWFRAHPAPRDVILVCKGSPGRVAMVPDPVGFCIAQDMVALRIDRDVAWPEYVYYRLLAADVQDRIENMHVGTLIPHFKKGDFGQLRFSVHRSIEDQRGIAEVLGALDDKIAANRKVIAGVADLIDARFRATEKHPGEATFADVAVVGGGGTPKTKIEEFWGGEVQWATPTDVTGMSGAWLRTTNRTITDSGLASCASSLYPEHSILMTSRATIGAFAVAGLPMAVNQGFIVVNAKEPQLQWWLYAQMRARTTEFLSHANGATFLELSRGRFKALPVWEGDSGAVHAFCSKVDVLMSKSRVVEIENETLAATRDGLLPLLMSGKLRVKDAEKHVGEVV